jgi:hypothetical protein
LYFVLFWACIPMAEENDLKSFKYGFESHHAQSGEK